MNLKRHLARLSQERSASLPQAGWQPVVVTDERERTLSDLRARMDEILARPLIVRDALARDPVLVGVAASELRARAPADFAELGFELHTETSVPVWRRRCVIGESACVGDMPITGISGSDPQILSLLALDPAVDGRDLGSALFLDTETTGLGGAGTLAFLLGMLYVEDGETLLEQVLLEGPEQELGLLEVFSARLQRASLIVSFNGKAFDWPLLAGRFVMNGLAPPQTPVHLDLLHVARRIHGSRLERCNLKHLESHVLGYVREEDIEGALVAERYLAYLRSSEAALLAQVVEHNRWDVLSMAALLNLYGQPLPRLPAPDLVGLARTLLRGKALDRASELLGHAMQAGAGPEALRVRADICRVKGDHEQRALDLEAAHRGLGDPRIRLELCKLYEHKLRRHERALELVRLGLAESEERRERREQRLLKKLRKSGSLD